jgi:hypothetical protein
MQLSAASQYSLKKFIQKEPDFAKQVLTDAASGDQLAMKALGEKTGITDAAQLRAAGQAYMGGQLDSLFAIGGSQAHQNATGAGPSQFSAGAGGVSAQNMSSFIAMRGGGGVVNHRRLGGQLESLDAQKQQQLSELSTLKTEKAGLEEQLGTLDLNFAERHLGGFFGLFGDKDKAKKGKGLRKDIEAKDNDISAKSGQVRRTEGEITAAVKSELKVAGDPRFKTLDGQLQKTGAMRKAASRLLGKISDAQSEVSSAQFHERMEANREQQEANGTRQRRQTGIPIPGDFSNPDYFGNSASRDAEQAMSAVNQETRRFNQTMQKMGEGDWVGGVSTTDMGNASDEWSDTLRDMSGQRGGGGGFLGGVLDMAGRLGSYNVLQNLSRAENELDSLESDVRGIKSQIDSRHSSVSSEMSAYINSVADQARASV